MKKRSVRIAPQSLFRVLAMPTLLAVTTLAGLGRPGLTGHGWRDLHRPRFSCYRKHWLCGSGNTAPETKGNGVSLSLRWLLRCIRNIPIGAEGLPGKRYSLGHVLAVFGQPFRVGCNRYEKDIR